MASKTEEAPTLGERADWVSCASDVLEVPRGTPTGYLTHGLFRYVGKLPPPLVAYLLHEFGADSDVVVDPMSGGGTTAIEAVTSGRTSLNFDVNPVSLLVTEAMSTQTDVAALAEFVDGVAWGVEEHRPPEGLAEYFSPNSYSVLKTGLKLAKSPAEQALVLSVARKASYANTKKINTVVDHSKEPLEAVDLLRRSLRKFSQGFEQLNHAVSGVASTAKGRADKLELEDGTADFVLLHPPYLSNTAFSEATELQLRLLDQEPVKLRDSELAYRGSYFHVPNGLKKYLIGWGKILAESYRVLRPDGIAAVVVGDGRVDGIRIPVGAISYEYGDDLGFKCLWRGRHILNNQTGWTLSRRMSEQHVLVFRK